MSGKNRKTNIVLISLIVMEHIFLYISYHQWNFSQSLNSKCLFLSSIAFGFALIYRFYKMKAVEEITPIKKLPGALLLLLLLVGLGLFAGSYNAIFHQYPIDKNSSDIIPEIQVACTRFLTGVTVYKPITDFGYELQLTYLPMQWLPYCIAQLLNIDPRWIAYVILCLASLVSFIRARKIGNIWLQAIVVVLLLAANYILFDHNPGIISSTVEIMVAGYYMLFIAALNQKNAVILGAGIALCLLSRYSLLLWLPLGAFVYYSSGHKKQLLYAIGTAAALVLLIYVWPFLSKDWSSFYKGYKYYDSSALGEWGKNVDDKGYPYHLYAGTGFAYIFYYKLSYLDIPARIKILQHTHVIVCLSATFIMGLWYWFNKKKIDYKIFLLASFKIYLALFLAFIQVPYEYLMITGNFVSIAIFCEQARYRLVKEIAISPEM